MSITVLGQNGQNAVNNEGKLDATMLWFADQLPANRTLISLSKDQNGAEFYEIQYKTGVGNKLVSIIITEDAMYFKPDQEMDKSAVGVTKLELSTKGTVTEEEMGAFLWLVALATGNGLSKEEASDLLGLTVVDLQWDDKNNGWYLTSAEGTKFLLTLGKPDESGKNESFGKIYRVNDDGSLRELGNISDGRSAEETRVIKMFNSYKQAETAGVSTFIPKTAFQKMIHSLSAQMNKQFLDIIAMSQVLANGSGLEGIKMLADKGVKIDGNDISNIVDVNKENLQILENIVRAGNETDIKTALETLEFTNDLTVGIKELPVDGKWTMDNIEIKLTDHEGILESPGTLFLVQQLLQQMKDAMQAVSATGKTPGDIRTTAVQSFVRDMNG